MQRVIGAAIIAAFGCAVGNEDDDETTAVAATSTTAMTTATTSTTIGEDSSDSGSSSQDDGGELPPPDCMPPLVACGGACVDLASDPNNCGQCGIACVLNNANAACVAGVCAMETCAPGFADCDANVATGCEHMIDCQAGGSCQTSCNTAGVLACDNPCATTCAAPAETCNVLDDDCDGACEQGLPGCRIPVHRAYGSNGHFYSTSVDEIAGAGLEMVAENYFWVYAAPHDGLLPLHRCIKPSTGGRRFLSQSANCEGLGPPELTLGYMSPDADCGATELYRLWAPSIDFHFFTISAAERDNAVANFGYLDYGPQGLIFGAP